MDRTGCKPPLRVIRKSNIQRINCHIVFPSQGGTTPDCGRVVYLAAEPARPAPERPPPTIDDVCLNQNLLSTAPPPMRPPKSGSFPCDASISTSSNAILMSSSF